MFPDRTMIGLLSSGATKTTTTLLLRDEEDSSSSESRTREYNSKMSPLEE